ncbi:MAG: 4-(cytidine 5'-diphospho)-2-C-methyl-D-erythritol kinase [Planctomycetia bacterium]|nr:4-(cytidine 5'-diphospho)-2-C-methyl-D-erythritol kinase [Planctomycetia bacterium]
MQFRASKNAVEVWAPAKLNLFLEVLGPREDGFHEIETLMCPVTLYDTLFFRPTEGSSGQEDISLTCDWAEPSPTRSPGERVPTDATNTALRAVLLLRERAGVKRGAAMRLVKRIPTTAGLGGGSSDAAAALLAANVAWGLNYPLRVLAPIAAEIGSDAPFFLTCRPALCTGRGERVRPLSGLGGWHFVVVKPPQGLATADVYRHCRVPSSPRSAGPLVEALRRGDLREVKRNVYNRLEEAAGRLTTWIGQARRRFEGLGFAAHQMSGSGTSYFGVCKSARQARRLGALIRSRVQGKTFVVSSAC